MAIPIPLQSATVCQANPPLETSGLPVLCIAAAFWTKSMNPPATATSDVAMRRTSLTSSHAEGRFMLVLAAAVGIGESSDRREAARRRASGK